MNNNFTKANYLGAFGTWDYDLKHHPCLVIYFITCNSVAYLHRWPTHKTFTSWDHDLVQYKDTLRNVTVIFIATKMAMRKL